MRTSDYDYLLPDDLIARYPADRRDASRLLVSDHSGSVRHQRFDDLPGLDDDDADTPDMEDLEDDADPDEPTDDEVPEGYLVEVPPLESEDDEPSADEVEVTDDEVPDDAA